MTTPSGDRANGDWLRDHKIARAEIELEYRDSIQRITNEWQTVLNELAQVRLTCSNVLRLDQPWPLESILNKLAEAADILLEQKNYDGDGWEQIKVARDAAREITKWLVVGAKIDTPAPPAASHAQHQTPESDQ